jgi:hypothetical protein
MGEVEQQQSLPPLSAGFAIADISPVPGEDGRSAANPLSATAAGGVAFAVLTT